MDKTVYFRAFEPEDADKLYKWLNDDDLKKLSIGLNKKMCKEEVREWIKCRMFSQNYQVWWAICSQDTNIMIGYLYLCDIHYINRSANFGGIVIGDKNYKDGFAWIESYLYIMEYAFERLNMNRLWCTYILDHSMTRAISECTYNIQEGLLRKAIYKNGRYYDEVIGSMLAEEYFLHKNNGDLEIYKIIKRLTAYKKEISLRNKSNEK